MTPSDETRALYESMHTDALLALKRTFEYDINEARRICTEAFAQGRIALIDAVLAAREAAPATVKR
jgi:hypothetical protein